MNGDGPVHVIWLSGIGSLPHLPEILSLSCTQYLYEVPLAKVYFFNISYNEFLVKKRELKNTGNKPRDDFNLLNLILII